VITILWNVKIFPTICHTPPAREEIGAILGFWWSGVKLPIWLLAFLLAITCVSDVEMGHASPFQTSMFQYIFNDIKNSSIQWVLTLQLPFENLGIHWDSNSLNGSPLGSVKVHSFTLFCAPKSMRCDSRTSLLATLQAFALVASPNLWLWQ
jgi:hypothetical protein